MLPRLVTVCAVATMMQLGCVGGPAPQRPSSGKRVWNIQIENLRGEAGRPFKSRVTWRDNYITEPELEVAGLPPGLIFDPASRTISGTPTEPGFHGVQVAVRQLVRVERNERGEREKPHNRWWVEEFQLEIYKPVGP